MSTAERFRLQGRRALVTGASSGLGRHFALSLAQAGATVIVAARSVDKLAETVAEIKAAGGDASAVRLDVTDPASVKGGFDEIEAGGVADVIVNNAGMAVSRPLLEQTEADWDSVLDTNLKGAWLVAQEAARRLVAAKRPGSIVNIASITGERVAGGVAPYCTSKAGVIHLTRAMALELARHGMRVNALAPGYVQTELNRDFLGPRRASDSWRAFRSGVSDCRKNSTDRCCCWPPMPARTSPAASSLQTEATWSAAYDDGSGTHGADHPRRSPHTTTSTAARSRPTCAPRDARSAGELQVAQFAGGQSNPTYLVTAGADRVRAAPQAARARCCRRRTRSSANTGSCARWPAAACRCPRSLHCAKTRRSSGRPSS